MYEEAEKEYKQLVINSLQIPKEKLKSKLRIKIRKNGIDEIQTSDWTIKE